MMTLLLNMVSTVMGEAEEEVAAEDELPADILVWPFMMHIENAKSEKEMIKFERMLEDHKKLLYPTCDADQKKVGYHTRIAAMEDKE
jgi:hypothetical protein